MSIGFSILLDSVNYIFDAHRIINLARCYPTNRTEFYLFNQKVKALRLCECLSYLLIVCSILH